MIELMVSVSIVGVLVSLLLPAVQQAREMARRSSCQSNLRQLGIGLHAFHEIHRVFPASGWTRSGPGNPGGRYVGWRAALLPHLEQSNLQSRYDFSQDWWSDGNLVVGSAVVPVFLCPSVPEQSPIMTVVGKAPRPALIVDRPLARSDYEALMGIRPVIQPSRYVDRELTRSVMFRNSRVRMADIHDGSSQTIVLVECAARPAVFRTGQLSGGIQNDQGHGWIDSESAFSLDGASADGAYQGLGIERTPQAMNATNENEPYSFHQGGAFFLFADGHVSFLSEQISLAVLAALSTRSAGEVIEVP